jgi:hypothetical protein
VLRIKCCPLQSDSSSAHSKANSTLAAVHCACACAQASTAAAQSAAGAAAQAAAVARATVTQLQQEASHLSNGLQEAADLCADLKNRLSSEELQCAAFQQLLAREKVLLAVHYSLRNMLFSC